VIEIFKDEQVVDQFMIGRGHTDRIEMWLGRGGSNPILGLIRREEKLVNFHLEISQDKTIDKILLLLCMVSLYLS